MASIVSALLSEGPAVIDIGLPQGATYRVQFTWVVDGQPQSLEGYKSRMSIVKKVKAGATPIITVTSDDGEIVLEPGRNQGDPPTGVVAVEITADKTALVNLKKPGRYDLILFDDETPRDVVRLVEGSVTIDLAVTEVA